MTEDTDTDAAAAPSARQDFLAGLLTVAFGIFVLSKALGYPMGTALRMGPGFFPVILAALIVVLGAALALHAFKRRIVQHTIDVNLRPVVMIGIAVATFALLLERTGLAPATVALVLLSSMAEPRWRPWRSLTLAVAMTALVYVVFIVVLQMPFAVVTW
jgi:hypothetical protein